MKAAREETRRDVSCGNIDMWRFLFPRWRQQLRRNTAPGCVYPCAYLTRVNIFVLMLVFMRMLASFVWNLWLGFSVIKPDFIISSCFQVKCRRTANSGSPAWGEGHNVFLFQILVVSRLSPTENSQSASPVHLQPPLDCSFDSERIQQVRWPYNEFYQLKVDVGMLNTVKIYWADVSSVSPSSERFFRAKGSNTLNVSSIHLHGV